MWGLVESDKARQGIAAKPVILGSGELIKQGSRHINEVRGYDWGAEGVARLYGQFYQFFELVDDMLNQEDPIEDPAGPTRR